MTSLSRCLAYVSVCLALWPAADGMAQENKPADLRPLPGNGVADPAGKTGFFPNTTGGIDALDLATGKLLWSSKEANLPLFATDNRLFAQFGKGNQLRVLSLDTSKEGQRVFESPALALPDWVSIDPTYGRKFRSGVRIDKSGLYVIWEARAFYAGGAAPPPELVKRANKNASGVSRIDADSGKVEPLDADKIAAGKFFPMSAEATNPKVGALTLTVTDGPVKNSKNPFARRRTLQAVNEAKQVVWERDIAPPIFLPPLP